MSVTKGTEQKKEEKITDESHSMLRLMVPGQSVIRHTKALPTETNQKKTNSGLLIIIILLASVDFIAFALARSLPVSLNYYSTPH